MKSITLFFALLLSSLTWAETGHEFLQKIQDNYNGLKSLEASMTYQLYKGFSGTAVIEEYQGQLMKSNSDSYKRIKNTEFINTKNYNIKVVHEQRMIVVTQNLESQFLNADIAGALEMCQDILVSKNEKGRVLTLTMRQGTDLPYSKIDVLVDEHYWMAQIVFYYSTLTDFSDDRSAQDFDFPKLVITYNSLNQEWKDKEGICEIKNYIREDHGELLPSELLSTYQIINLTQLK